MPIIISEVTSGVFYDKNKKQLLSNKIINRV
jgi:hypothetical protein